MAIFTGTAAAAAGLAAKLGLGTKLAGALSAAKSLVGMGGAAKATAGVGSAMKAGAGMPGVLGGTGARMAGTKLASSPMFAKGIGKAVFGDMTKGQIATRLAPDVAFGVIGGAMTPGDLGDKLIAGSSQAIGGGIGGLAVGRGLARAGVGNTAQTIGDFVGSYGGDFAGMAAGDAAMRAKDRLFGGSGQTPYERLGAEQQDAFIQQIRNQTLQQAGLLPGLNSQYLGLGTGFDG
jgi:hypothetical protein